MLCSFCMSLGVSPQGKPLKLALWDVSRAHLYGDTQRDLYVELPIEDSHHSDDVEPMRGLLLRSMYGTQDASQIWQKNYTKLLGGEQWKQGQSNGALFYDTVTQSRAVAHGDGFLLLGDDDDVKRMDETLRSRYDCKSGGVLGPDPEDDTEVTYLNMVIRYVRGSHPLLLRLSMT
eukprot:2806772-Amphidinium_carterae.3